LTFPNPANNELTFLINGHSEEEQCNIRIYDVNGKLMSIFNIEKNNTPKTIQLSEYASGFYFYKAASGNKTLQNKLVIIK
jgi:hypothetical protein